ncbi:MAG: large-conductance mechanosensitive channel protein MscL [Candidatus Peribacteraceae bacterium]|nr:large-conductance mechanosensitive channel protein MscL [Candidatus Peribacteraceae bacterium]
MLKEFRDFAMRGNVMDLAVGVIIGGAFGKIVSSLVNDLIMPAFGIILGNLDFSALALTIGESKIAYGLFIQSVVDFVIVAFCIFLMIQQLQRFKKKKPDVPAAPPEEIRLLTEIRDALKKS